MAGNEELDRLVEKGRRLAAQDGEREGRQARWNKDSARDERHLHGYASVSFYVRFGWILAAAALCVPLGFGLYALLPQSWFQTTGDEEGGGIGILVLMCAMVVPFVALWFTRRAAGRSAWAREKAWAASQPFPVVGYPDLLHHGNNDCRVCIRFSFAGATPDRATLEAVARTFGGKLDEEGRSAETRWDWSDYESGGPTTNAFVRKYVHEAVERLRVLHASYPLNSVKLSIS
ncbi:MAG: hypothetical protein QM765_10060 [Myxococcales bacterium]